MLNHSKNIVLSLFIRSMSNASTDLKKILAEKIPKEQERVAAFRKKYGTTKVGDVTVNMMYGGMRGMLGLVWEPSVLDPEEGITFRGKSIPECQKILPKIKDEPLPEGLFWLLITNDVPTEAQAKKISKEWASRSELPDYIVKILKNFPKSVHPMHQFSAALTILSTDSIFKKEYEAGIHKSKYWDPTYEDAMNLIARLPVLCAMIYRNIYKDGKLGASVDPDGDWSGNFAKMLGYDDPQFAELLRLYVTIHADHEGGNVSAHATHLVASALSDPYLAFGSGMNGLAGPLHGLANQEVLLWLKKMCAEIGDSPTDDELKDFIWKTLKSGQVIPGYGHSVLRKTDPRYICQRDYAIKHMLDDKLIKLVAQMYKVVPPILMELGKVANPWPNVDAHSGALLQCYGMTEMQYYTVLFGISRALGIMASLVWSRALGLPIERPKSLSTEKLMELVKAK